MKEIKKYYKLIVLLICVGAFPTAVVAMPIDNNVDSSICSFHSETNDSKRILVQCDHCDYFADVDLHLISQINYTLESNATLDSILNKSFLLLHLPTTASRSPPLV